MQFYSCSLDNYLISCLFLMQCYSFFVTSYQVTPKWDYRSGQHSRSTHYDLGLPDMCLNCAFLHQIKSKCICYFLFFLFVHTGIIYNQMCNLRWGGQGEGCSTSETLSKWLSMSLLAHTHRQSASVVIRSWKIILVVPVLKISAF